MRGFCFLAPNLHLNLFQLLKWQRLLDQRTSSKTPSDVNLFTWWLYSKKHQNIRLQWIRFIFLLQNKTERGQKWLSRNTDIQETWWEDQQLNELNHNGKKKVYYRWMLKLPTNPLRRPDSGGRRGNRSENGGSLVQRCCSRLIWHQPNM